MKALRNFAIGIAALIVLLVVAAGIAVATFDPNRHKAQLVGLMKDRFDRTLTIDGPIELRIFPRIGAAASGITLSERASPRPFARVADARVSVALLPLFAGKVVVDRIELAGLDVEIVRHADGRTNLDDLLGKPAAPGKGEHKETATPAFVVDVSGVRLRNAAIGYRLDPDGPALHLSDVELVTDRIAAGIPGKVSLTGRVKGERPTVEAEIKLAGQYRFAFDQPALFVDGLDVQAHGNLAGVAGLQLALTADVALMAGNRVEVSKLRLEATSKDGLEAKLGTSRVAVSDGHTECAPVEATLKSTQGSRRIEAQLALSAAKGSGPRVDFASVGLTLDSKAPNLTVKGRIASPLTIDLDSGALGLAQLAGEFDLAHPAFPDRSVRLAVGGRVQGDWTAKRAQAELTARFDESNLRLKLDVADLLHPAPQFDLVADRLDLDRYVGGASAKGAAAKAPQGAAPAREEPIDLSALKSLDAAGQLHVGSLTTARIRAQDVAVRMRLAKGVLQLDPVSARLYEGSTTGAASVDANAQRYALRQQMVDVAVGPLLRDAADKDVLEGRGTFAVDVTTAGPVLSALRRNLNGKVALQLRDGAVKGVDLGAIARRAGALRSGNLESAASPRTEKTDFTELSATFVLKDGVARNDDLSAKSPFLRFAGAGSIDVGSGSLDYLVKATIVGTPAGQEGKALADLRGLTIPVKLSGPFDGLKYSVDAGALAAELAKGELNRRLEGTVPKGSLEETLKGLFRR